MFGGKTDSDGDIFAGNASEFSGVLAHHRHVALKWQDPSEFDFP
jgi:hypothetical protein